MRINELRKEIDSAIKKHTLLAESITDLSNPQTKEVYVYNCHIVQVLQAVVGRIDNDRLSLQLL